MVINLRYKVLSTKWKKHICFSTNIPLDFSNFALWRKFPLPFVHEWARPQNCVVLPQGIFHTIKWKSLSQVTRKSFSGACYTESSAHRLYDIFSGQEASHGKCLPFIKVLLQLRIIIVIMVFIIRKLNLEDSELCHFSIFSAISSLLALAGTAHLWMDGSPAREHVLSRLLPLTFTVTPIRNFWAILFFLWKD